VAAVVATTLGLCVGELLTALVPSTASPFVAVGNELIDRTPHAVKDWAVAHFGTADKPVLLGGIAVGLLLSTIVVGLVAGEHARLGTAMFLVVGLVGAGTAVLDQSASAGLETRLLAAAASLIVGLSAFLVLLRLARRPERPTLHAPSTSVEPGEVEGPDGTDKPIDRRVFLLTASALGAAAVAGASVGHVVSRSATGGTVALPRPGVPARAIPAGASIEVPGITSHITPNEAFYRVDTALRIPRLTVVDYQLRIHGLVDNPRTYSFADLLARRLVERRITLTCVSNPVGGPYAGSHRLQVRATDADGTTQDSRRAPVAPDGATGWHSVSVTVEK
jgi:hypothetical protein